MSQPRFGPLPAAIALALGIAIAPLVAPWLAWPVAAAAGLIALRHVRWRPAFLALAVVALGAARGDRAIPVLAGSDDRVVDRVVGVVGGPVVRSPRGTGAPLDTGAAVIWLWADVELVPGERVAATGYLRIPRGLLDPAMPDRADAVASRGADHELVAQHVERLDDEAGPTALAWRWAGDLQQRWARAIDDAGGDPVGRAALRGIVVGDRGDVPDALDRRWRAVGIYHVLSVSGLHLAVVAGLVFAALCRLIAASPWGGRVRPAAWAAPPALVLAIGYTLVTGAQLATLRALVVVALAMIAAMIDRPLRLIDALGFAALAILAWRPMDLFDPSFQLSFTAALTLAIRPRVARVATGRLRAIGAAIQRGIATSAWVALTTAPITAFHFQQVAAGGVIGNLILTPPVELIALPVTLGGLALGIPPLVTAAAWLVGFVDRAAGLLARIVPVGTIAVASMTTMAVLVALSLCLALRPGRRVAAIAWLALCLAWSRARAPAPPGVLRVTFLDVGQGDAAIVELPDGATWLVDAGGLVGARDLAAQTAPGLAVTRVLQAYGHDHVDLAIISHPHPDHYLGLASLGVPVGELWSAAEPEPSGRPGRPRDTLPSFETIARATGAMRVHPPLGVARRQADVELAVWAPRFQAAEGEPVIEAADPVRTVNDNSLVVAIRYAGRTIVFAGDLEAEGEDALVAAGLAQVDVVKVAHHGSPTSSTARFVAAMHPKLAVISCGRGNHFGFPSLDVLARWRAAGAEIARTDTDGAITVSVDLDGAMTIDRFSRAIPPAPP